MNATGLVSAAFAVTLLCASPAVTAAGKKPAAPSPAPSPAAAPAGAPQKFEFDSWYVIFLKKGPAWSGADTPENAALQKAHLAHLGELGRAGKLLAAGPYDEQDDPTLRGICITSAKTKEEARQMELDDPAVKAGHLVVEVAKWYALKGAVVFHPEVADALPK